MYLVEPVIRMHRFDMRFFLVALLSASAICGTSLAEQAAAAQTALLGTWKLVAYARQDIETGKTYDVFGANPAGYVSYGPDGRMSLIIVRGDRQKPATGLPTDRERTELHKGMIAYAGTYRVESDKVTHQIDISWNEAFTGTHQVRFVSLKGDMLTLTTAPQKSSSDGRLGIGILVWRKLQ